MIRVTHGSTLPAFSRRSGRRQNVKRGDWWRRGKPLRVGPGSGGDTHPSTVFHPVQTAAAAERQWSGWREIVPWWADGTTTRRLVRVLTSIHRALQPLEKIRCMLVGVHPLLYPPLTVTQKVSSYWRFTVFLHQFQTMSTGCDWLRGKKGLSIWYSPWRYLYVSMASPRSLRCGRDGKSIAFNLSS